MKTTTCLVLATVACLGTVFVEEKKKLLIFRVLFATLKMLID